MQERIRARIKGKNATGQQSKEKLAIMQEKNTRGLVSLLKKRQKTGFLTQFGIMSARTHLNFRPRSRSDSRLRSIPPLSSLKFHPVNAPAFVSLADHATRRNAPGDCSSLRLNRNRSPFVQQFRCIGPELYDLCIAKPLMKHYNLRAWGITGLIWFRLPSSRACSDGSAAGSQAASRSLTSSIQPAYRTV